MTLVVDASVVVAALVDSGSDGRWAEKTLASDELAGPHLMPVEVTNILRRASRAGEISDDTAWYVAVAEMLDAKLATLDEKVSRATGPRCGFVVPGS